MNTVTLKSNEDLFQHGIRQVKEITKTCNKNKKRSELYFDYVKPDIQKAKNMLLAFSVLEDVGFYNLAQKHLVSAEKKTNLYFGTGR